MRTHAFGSRVGALVAALLLSPPIIGHAAAAELPRANVVLTSAIAVDADAGTATLPLHRGTAGGQTVWYIVTDSSDKDDAQKRGVVYAPLLAGVGAGCAACLRTASERNGAIVFPGAPDFSPNRSYVPSATGFPPASAQPGATSTGAYTPFLRVGGAVINAPIVATGNGPFDVTTHRNTADRVVAIDSQKKTVTLVLARGFAAGKKVLYLSTEASDPGAAAVERAIYVPALKAKGGVVPIDVVANGPHQGLGFVALHGRLGTAASATNAASLGSPLNILSSFPTGATAGAYTPLWAVTVLAWKPAARAAAPVLTSLADVSQHDADLTGPDGKSAPGPVGFVVNCPVIAYVDDAP